MDGEFAAGSRVRARGLAWDVVEVVPLGAQTLLRLRCVAGDLAGLEWDFLHPAEALEKLRVELRPDMPGSLAAWRLHHQAALLEQILSPADPPVAAPGRVRIEPYQLVPLARALQLPRARLLLADGVGLGKTVQAGLIAAEFIARRRAHRILVVAPPGPLLVQWSQELRQRFGLRFTTIADASALHALRRRLELGGNPFDAIALCLTSLDFAKQERVLADLERAAWDLAIIDEAHHCIAAGIEREETQRRRLAEVVARRSDGLLLLTATPHDGHDQHFASLMELLDPSLVDGSGGLVGTAYRRHVVRRLKSHIRHAVTGAPLFRERRIVPVKVDVADAAVRQFHTALAELIAPRLRRASRSREHADALAFVSLLKRSVSTMAACLATLRVVAERYRLDEAEAMRRERAKALRAYRRRLLRFGVLDALEEADVAELEADSMAADLREASGDTAMALAALIRLGEIAQRSDPKLDAVIGEVCAIRRQHPGANILVYTEYADSQSVAVEALRRAVDGEVLSINGSHDEAERARIADRFAETDNIVLLSTDSLAEGLNLQQHCWHLIHLDLPYNPNRLEQRNGRIDRYGQTREPQIRYLYLAGTFEERLLLRLIAKFEKARAHLTFMPDTLGVTADEDAWRVGLVAGFAESQAGLFDDAASAIRTLDQAGEDTGVAAYRELLHEIERSFDGFDRSAVRHGWFDPSEPNAELLPADVPSTGVDLVDFVSAAVAAEPGGRVINGTQLQLPADWLAGLDDLPGFDRNERLLRITRDRTRLRDEDGHALAFLGRAHPVVRRAVARVQVPADPLHDSRVSVCRASDDIGLSVLLSYAIELRGTSRCAFRRLLTVLMPANGAAEEVPDPRRWLGFADLDRQVLLPNAWHELFVGWVPARRAEAEALVDRAMQRDAALRTDDYRHRADMAGRDLQRWLQRRADHISGAYVPRTGDLFGASTAAADWQMMRDPLERLAAYGADGGNPALRRREANDAVALWQYRRKEWQAAADLSSGTARPLGMLMLVP